MAKRNTPKNDTAAVEMNDIDYVPEVAEWVAERMANGDVPENYATEEHPVEDLEAAVHAIEAYEDEATEDAIAEEIESVIRQVTFGDLVANVTDSSYKSMKAEMAAQLDARLEFEERKSLETGKDNIFRNLSKTRGKLVAAYAPSATFCALDIDPAFFNRVLHDGSRYSVYAANKLADLCEGLVNSGLANAINQAIVRSLFAVEAAGGQFTMELAKAACSKQYRVDSPYSRNLIRHSVSTSTAPTQASSTMQALQTLGVVRLVSSRKNAAYEVVDGPATRRLKEVIAA